ncbi:MAG TPA: PEP-CTERM sorting domain-containing protein [Nitrospira sp.]|nr:PEP-CTERM sorting domain-containing protein [Nitrospira sp.]
MTRPFLRFPLAIALGLFLFAIVTPAFATPLGSFNVANCSGGGVTISETSLTWLPLGTVAGTGCIDTGAGTNIVYSGGTLGGGVAGNLSNLSLSSALPLNNFMTFSGSTLDFMLTGGGPGAGSILCGGLLVGQSCSIAAGSPFILTSLGSNTLFSFNVFGTVADATGTSTWSGAFTSQFNMTAAAIQTLLLAGGSITSTYSGQFTLTPLTSVPEPATLAFLGFGMAGLAGLRRLRNKTW